MPTYEYACKKCGETFDVVQSFSDEPLKRHKGGCGGALKKVFGSVGISFKGTGFYKNDSRSSSKSSSSAESSSSTEATSSESATTSTSETKTETKADSPKTESPKKDAAKKSGASSSAKAKS